MILEPTFPPHIGFHEKGNDIIIKCTKQTNILLVERNFTYKSKNNIEVEINTTILDSPTCALISKQLSKEMK